MKTSLDPEKDSLPGMKASNWYNADIFVYPSFKRTLAILEETGYPLSMDEVPIASVRADFYSQDREYMHTLEYTEKQEVEQIKKVLIPVNLLPAWADVDYSIDLSYTPEPGVNMVYDIYKRLICLNLWKRINKHMKAAVRLDKFLADAGTGTRSEVKKYIKKGLVQVNGVTVKSPEQKVVPGKDQVSFMEKSIEAAPEFAYFSSS